MNSDTTHTAGIKNGLKAIVGAGVELLDAVAAIVKGTLLVFAIPIGGAIVLSPLLQPAYAETVGPMMAQQEPYFTVFSYLATFVLLFYLQHGENA